MVQDSVCCGGCEHVGGKGKADSQVAPCELSTVEGDCVRFHFVHESDVFDCLKDVYSAKGYDGYRQCRLVVPRPEQFVPARPGEFREVLTSGLVKMVREHAADRIVIAYSGGIDSECIAMACLDGGISPLLRTVAWRSNRYDIDHSLEFSRRHGVPHAIIDIDTQAYLRNDLYEWVWGAECAAEVYFSAEKVLIDGLSDDEVLLFGAGAPPNVQCRDDGQWVLRHPLVDPASYYQYARYRRKRIWCPYVDDAVTRATWTSEVLMLLKAAGQRYFQDIWQYGSERGVSEDEWKQAKGILYSSFPELRYRAKFHGWEKELSRSLFGVANKPRLEAYFEECLKAGRRVPPLVRPPEIGELPENPFYAQAMGSIPWVPYGTCPLDSYDDWDLSGWGEP